MEVREVGANYGFTEARDAPAGYKQTEVGLIPEDWVVEPLAALLKFKNGLNKSKGFFGSGTPIVNYMDVYSHSALRAADIRGRVDVTTQELDAFSVRQGDVFFTRTSETVDEIGVACVLLDDSPQTVFSGFVLRGRPKSDVLVDIFKKYCFSSSIFREQVVSKSTYTTRALTSGRVLSGIGLPFPPDKAEQEAIADALSDADALIESLDQLIAKKRQIKQGTMQALLTGEQRLPGFHVEWTLRRLGDLTEMSSGGTPLTSNPHFYGGGIPWVSIADMTQGGKVITSTSQNLTPVGLASSAAKMFPSGTVLYAMYASLGECGIAGVPLCSSQAILGIRTKPALSNDFLYYLLTSVRHAVRAMGQQGAQSNLNKGIVQDMEFCIPELEEQTAIATILTDMDTELAELETRLAKTRQLKQGMMQELLTGRIRLV